MAHDTKLHNSDDSAVLPAGTGGVPALSNLTGSSMTHVLEEQAEWLIHNYRRRGYEI